MIPQWNDHMVCRVRGFSVLFTVHSSQLNVAFWPPEESWAVANSSCRQDEGERSIIGERSIGRAIFATSDERKRVTSNAVGGKGEKRELEILYLLAIESTRRLIHQAKGHNSVRGFGILVWRGCVYRRAECERCIGYRSRKENK